MELKVLERLNQARRERAAAILVTEAATGAVRLVVEGDGYAADPLRQELAARFRSGVSGSVTDDASASFFLTVQLPPPRLVVIGAVHISQALAPMARIAGFDVTIIDPRTAFATAERFPDVSLLAEWPDEALPKVGLDPFTALVALSHDPKIDDQPITMSLTTGCFYVGALGSRKTHVKRLERLGSERGLDDAALSRIRAPIGLNIGAKSPAEIAVAILAQIIEALRNRGKDDEEAAG